MTDREKRNEVDEGGIVDAAEILVRATFREDEDDEGFVTTRWVSASALADALAADGNVDTAELIEAFEMLEARIGYVKQLLLAQADDE